MRAKRTFAVSSSCGLALVGIAAGVGQLPKGATSVASDPVGGQAQLAVQKARSKATQSTEQARSLDMVRLRSQVEGIELAKTRKQNEARARRLARNAAAARARALDEANGSARRERASRDAQRAKLEAERRKYEGTPREVARKLLPDHGWSSDQFDCLDSLWTKESGWRVDADNPTSSAYGIPQALPGIRMAEYGDDWRTNPVTQIKWGLDYIEDAYGSPCAAWSHSKNTGWY